MKLSHCAFLLAMATPVVLFGQKRETIELQRDVATLQDQIRTLQRTVDEKLTALSVQVQQTLDSATKSNTSVAVLESGIRDRLNEQNKNIAAPVANLNAKIDQMTSEFQAVRGAIEDMNSRVTKLQTQLTDLSNTMKVMQSPPSAPGAAMSAPGAPVTGVAAPPPGVSATQLYETARKDLSGGNLDLALQGFNEYLKYFDNTEYAPNAQFYIGQIYYNKSDFENAIRAFDLVLEHYQENPKTPDATYMKGMAQLKSGERTKAGQEFLNVIQKYPKSEVAPKARDARRALGLSVPAASAAPASAAKKRRR